MISPELTPSPYWEQKIGKINTFDEIKNITKEVQNARTRMDGPTVKLLVKNIFEKYKSLALSKGDDYSALYQFENAFKDLEIVFNKRDYWEGRLRSAVSFSQLVEIAKELQKDSRKIKDKPLVYGILDSIFQRYNELAEIKQKGDDKIIKEIKDTEKIILAQGPIPQKLLKPTNQPPITKQPQTKSMPSNNLNDVDDYWNKRIKNATSLNKLEEIAIEVQKNSGKIKDKDLIVSVVDRIYERYLEVEGGDGIDNLMDENSIIRKIISNINYDDSSVSSTKSMAETTDIPLNTKENPEKTAQPQPKSTTPREQLNPSTIQAESSQKLKEPSKSSSWVEQAAVTIKKLKPFKKQSSQTSKTVEDKSQTLIQGKQPQTAKPEE